MERLNQHRNECNKIVTTMPTIENNFLTYDFFKRELEVPFAIYADFECILKNVDTCSPQPSMSSPPCIIVSYFILNRSHFFYDSLVCNFYVMSNHQVYSGLYISLKKPSAEDFAINAREYWQQ
jgi:hypothetical protein